MESLAGVFWLRRLPRGLSRLADTLRLGTGSILESVSGSHPGEPLALTPAGKLLDTDFPDPFAGGEYLGHLPFLREAEALPSSRVSESARDITRDALSTSRPS